MIFNKIIKYIRITFSNFKMHSEWILSLVQFFSGKYNPLEKTLNQHKTDSRPNNTKEMPNISKKSDDSFLNISKNSDLNVYNTELKGHSTIKRSASNPAVNLKEAQHEYLMPQIKFFDESWIKELEDVKYEEVKDLTEFKPKLKRVIFEKENDETHKSLVSEI